MTIDKRINYQWGGPGGHSPGPGSGGPGPGGQGARGQATQNPGRAPAPSRGPVTTAVAPPSILSKLGPKTDVHHHTDTIEDVIQQTILDKQYRDEKEKFEEDWVFEDIKAKAPKTLAPPKKTYERGIPFLEDTLVKTVTPPKYSPTYYQDRSKIGGQTWGERAEDDLNRGFFDSGIGKALKWGAMALVPGLLPAKAAKAYTMYNQAKTISKYAKDFGLTEKDIMSSLTKNLRSNVTTDLLSGKRSTTDTTDTRDDRFGQRDRDGRQVTAVPKADVVTEGVQKFTPSKEQLTELQKRRAILQGYADKGTLNERGQNTLMQMNQFLEKYLVSVAHGGFIDKPLMGRSRDI